MSRLAGGGGAVRALGGWVVHHHGPPAGRDRGGARPLNLGWGRRSRAHRLARDVGSRPRPGWQGPGQWDAAVAWQPPLPMLSKSFIGCSAAFIDVPDASR